MDRGHNRWAYSQNKLGTIFVATQKSFFMYIQQKNTSIITHPRHKAKAGALHLYRKLVELLHRG